MGPFYRRPPYRYLSGHMLVIAMVVRHLCKSQYIVDSIDSRNTAFGILHYTEERHGKPRHGSTLTYLI